MWIANVLIFVGIFTYPIFMLRPIIRKASVNRGRKIKTWFSIADFLALVFLIQIPLVLINVSGADLSRYGIRDGIAVSIGLVVPVVLLWLSSIRAICHCEISGQLRRFVTTAIVFPLAIFGGVALPAMCFVLHRFATTGLDAPSAWVFLAGYFVSAIALWYLVRWVIRESTEVEMNLDSNDDED